jgi:hypothetical protein
LFDILFAFSVFGRILLRKTALSAPICFATLRKFRFNRLRKELSSGRGLLKRPGEQALELNIVLCVMSLPVASVGVLNPTANNGTSYLFHIYLFLPVKTNPDVIIVFLFQPGFKPFSEASLVHCALITQGVPVASLCPRHICSATTFTRRNFRPRLQSPTFTPRVTWRML